MNILKVGDKVRIKTAKWGSMNEFGRVSSVSENGESVGINNMNMPFIGTYINKTFSIKDVEKSN